MSLPRNRNGLESKRAKGFTLIELLIVIAIIGILAAIAIPNLLNALNRSKQKRTMADIRNIAIAWETRETESGTYSSAGAAAPFTFPAVSMPYSSLQSILSPTFMRTVPPTDGWNHAFGFGVNDNPGYAIRSPGRDGDWQSSYVYDGVRGFDCDIVYSDGAFVQYPDGVLGE